MERLNWICTRIGEQQHGLLETVSLKKKKKRKEHKINLQSITRARALRDPARSMLWNCFAVRVSEWNARLNGLEKKKEKLTLLLHNRLALFLKFPFPVQVEQTYSDHTLCKHIWRRAELEFMIVHSFSSFILFTFVSLPQFIGLLFCYLNRCYSVLFLLPSCSPIFFLWVRFSCACTYRDCSIQFASEK